MDNGACHIVKIYDVMGRVVFNYQFSTVNSQLKIDISIFPAGGYFIQIQTETGTVTRKIIKSER
jgi:hypothetical protein